MKRGIIKYCFTLLIIAFLFSCERDDICPPTTPTTPLLIIEFFDVSETEENKSVQNLSYIAEGATEGVLINGSTDSIAIPLNTNLNTTRYQFIRNTDDANFENADVIEFIYQKGEVYVNRSCGFKAIFRDLSAIRQVENPPTNNWIRSVIIEQTDVENEQNTHVSILH